MEKKMSNREIDLFLKICGFVKCLELIIDDSKRFTKHGNTVSNDTVKMYSKMVKSLGKIVDGYDEFKDSDVMHAYERIINEHLELIGDKDK